MILWTINFFFSFSLRSRVLLVSWSVMVRCLWLLCLGLFSRLSFDDSFHSLFRWSRSDNLDLFFDLLSMNCCLFCLNNILLNNYNLFFFGFSYNLLLASWLAWLLMNNLFQIFVSLLLHVNCKSLL